MNIGILCYPTFGGSGVVATELGKALSLRGHQVYIISYQPPARLDHFLENLNFVEVSFTNYPLFDHAPYETALASKIVDTVKFSGLDILHAHYAIPHASAAFLARSILEKQGVRIPFVTTLHGTDITLVGKDPTFAPVVSFSIECSNGVSAVSESLKQDTYKNFEVEKDIEVIPNFIDLSHFRKNDKSHFKKAIAPNGEKILLHTSNFRKVKRIQDLMHIFKAIRQDVDAKLLLIGDGPERQPAEQLCRELGTCGDVRFLGKQDAVGELLAVADLFLLPSEHESFGLSALEAMACHVPVISSNAGGLPEVNIHGETGFNCEVGNIEEFAQRSIQLLTNKTLLLQFSDAARKRAELFDVNKIVPQYEAFYKKYL